MSSIAICIPVYNDWDSIKLLLPRIDRVAGEIADTIDVLIVEDGSEPADLSAVAACCQSLGTVATLRLRRNLGHQRAITIGLTHLFSASVHDVVVVMDGDGEDQPEDVPQLLARCREHAGTHVVFAARSKRTEGFIFRCGYAAYRALHRLLVGRRVEVGNFSAVPRAALARIVSVSESWNHYAAAVHHARIPVDSIPIARGCRLAGQSRMNFVSLVVHGLSAISVYSDVVGVRILMLIAMLMGLCGGGILVIIAIRLYTALAIPGWATMASGILLVNLLNLAVLGSVLTLFTLRSRNEYAFLPIRDYEHFILDKQTWKATTNISSRPRTRAR